MMPLGDFSAIPCNVCDCNEVARGRLASVAHADLYLYRAHLWLKTHNRDGFLTGLWDGLDLGVSWTADGMGKFGTVEAFFRSFGWVSREGKILGWEFNDALREKRARESEKKAKWRASKAKQRSKGKRRGSLK